MKNRSSQSPLTGATLRLLDLLIAGPLLALVLLPMLVISLLIWLDDRGSVFFRQTRVGRNLKPFHILKFRTMFVDPDRPSGETTEGDARTQRPAFQTTKKGDSRITRIGRFLRPTHLDELPQLINVVKGDMSLVGVRPDVPVQIADYTKEIWVKRHRFLPGITGVAQVAPNVESTEHRTSLDMEWINNRSIKLYFIILFKTFGKVLKRNSL